MKLTKIILGIAALSIIAGCSSTSLLSKDKEPTVTTVVPNPKPEEVTVQAAATFSKPNGKVDIVFDSKGNWESISATAAGGISANTYEAREQATTIATMRAKRNIASFLSTELSSTKTLVVVSKTLQKANETKENRTNTQPVSLSDEEKDSVDKELAGNSNQINLDKNSFVVGNMVREHISESSNAILKGLQVVSQGESPDGKSVLVELKILRKNIGLANAIRIEMQ